MTGPILDVASVSVQLDSRRAERDARRVGERVGRAFTRAANAAARDIEVDFDIDEAALRRQLRSIDAELTVRT